MKKLLFLLVLSYVGVSLNGTFKFVDSKSQGALAIPFVKELIKIFKVDNFFETGTYNADTTVRIAPLFKKVVTVELHNILFQKAKSKLAQFKNVAVIHGQSPQAIEKYAPKLDGRILFWLDAHYSGEGTALGYNNPSACDAITAIRGELEAIKAVGITDCIILIDDIRGFGTQIGDTEFLGCWAYPNVQEVHRALLEINPRFKLALLGDTLLAYDGSVYNPEFSDAVIGCTKTRLYDGNNLSDEELVQAEKLIEQALPEEKQFILKLYRDMTDYKDPMFWHDMWAALVQWSEGNYVEAQKAFKKVLVRKQYLTKEKQPDSLIIHYDHGRINEYINSCNLNRPL